MKKYRVYTHADFVFAEHIEAESEEQALEIHNQHKDMSAGADWDFCDDIDTKVEEDKPSLEEMFDKKKSELDDAKKREWEKLRKMDLDERAWIADMVGNLEFLESRGFRVRPYYGGIVDKWPHNYIQVEKCGRWVAIEGSSVRSSNGTIDQTSPYIANYLNPTMEELINIIAKW